MVAERAAQPLEIAMRVLEGRATERAEGIAVQAVISLPTHSPVLYFPSQDPPSGSICGEIMLFTHLQLIKAAFVAVLETRSVGSTWLQRERERERFELRSKSKQELREMLKKKGC